MVNFKQVSWSVDIYLIAYIFLPIFSEQRGVAQMAIFSGHQSQLSIIVSLTLGHSIRIQGSCSQLTFSSGRSVKTNLVTNLRHSTKLNLAIIFGCNVDNIEIDPFVSFTHSSQIIDTRGSKKFASRGQKLLFFNPARFSI